MNTISSRTVDVLSQLYLVTGVQPTPYQRGHKAKCPACDGDGTLRVIDSDGDAPQVVCTNNCTGPAIFAALEQAAIWEPPTGIAPVTVSLADIQPESVRWLWPNRIAIGKITLVAGDPGLGKSFVCLDLAARVSTGSEWPDGQGAFAEPGGVVLLSAEDGLSDTIRPRLDAARADVSRITAIQATEYTLQGERKKNGRVERRPFNLVYDLPALERAIKAVANCRIVIIDPITAYLGDKDSHKNAEIRGVLAPLADLAERNGVALIAVTHLNKSSTMSAIYRAMGSLAFVAAARAVWAVVKDKNDPDGRRRFFLPLKNNLGNDRTGLAFELSRSTSLRDTACVCWSPETVNIDADEALSQEASGAEKRTAMSDAKNWLEDMLKGGPQPAKEIKAGAHRDGIASRTLDRAKAGMKVNAYREGYGNDGRWLWRLSEETNSASESPSTLELAHKRGVGALWEEPRENGQQESPKDRQDIKGRQSTTGVDGGDD